MEEHDSLKLIAKLQKGVIFNSLAIALLEVAIILILILKL